MRKVLIKKINSLKQLQQSQASLNEQLKYLKVLANKFGLYDAADYLTRLEEKKGDNII